VHRSVVAVDVEGSTGRSDLAKARLRRALYGLLQAALKASGMSESWVDPLVDRGDGALVLIRPSDHLPKTLLLSMLVPMLYLMLDRHNRDNAEHAFRLRVAVHAGEVQYDERGPFGEALDITCRLLDSHELKVALRNTRSPVALAVSDVIYRSVVLHGYGGIDSRWFLNGVAVEIAGQTHQGWLLAGGPHLVRPVSGNG
jgi:hypothetical protein